MTSIYDDYIVLAGETDDGQKLRVKLRVDPVTGALKVTGAGAQPSATSLRIKDATLDQWAKVDAQGNLYVFNLDIAASKIYDALVGLELASKVMVWADVHVAPDTVAAEKLRYLCIAPPGTLLTDATWTVGQFAWSRRGADLYKLTAVRSKHGISLLTTGTDDDPWPNVKARLDALEWNL